MYNNLKIVEPLGLSGGLAIFWKDNLVVDLHYAEKNLIDMKVSNGSKSWFVNCVYGDPTTNLRSLVRDRITSFGVLRSEAWSLVGDFNVILSN